MDGPANLPCPRCREQGRDATGDHAFRMRGGDAYYCNRCDDVVIRPDTEEDMTGVLGAQPAKPSGNTPQFTMETIAQLKPGKVPSRGLSAPFMELYDIRVAYDPATREPTHVFFPRHKGGKAVGWKMKALDGSRYTTVGDGKDNDLFGEHLDGGRRMCIVVEGELDAVAAKQMLADPENWHDKKGRDYRVVSLANGAGTVPSKSSIEWLSNFESVIIMTDMDGPGDKAAERLSDLLGARCKRASLPCKDANDCLVQGKGKEFIGSLGSAKSITQDGIVTASDTWDAVLKDFTENKDGGVPFPWDSLNALSYGMRLGELDTWTSGSGMGKSAVMRELTHHLSMTHDKKVGILALEESMASTMMGQMSIVANKPLHLPEVRQGMTEEELRGYWDEVANRDNLVIMDHFGSVNDDTLISKLRYMASGMGCKYIIIDHLSIIISEFAADGDERKNIDVLMTKLKKLTEELKIHISLVSHLKKSDGKPFEEGRTPSADDLRGSASIKQLSHGIYALSRNQQDPDLRKRNTVKLTVLKNRFCGRTGTAGFIEYDADTGRLNASNMTEEDYEGGANVLTRPGIG